jgi:hypothetical protein
MTEIGSEISDRVPSRESELTTKTPSGLPEPQDPRPPEPEALGCYAPDQPRRLRKREMAMPRIRQPRTKSERASRHRLAMPTPLRKMPRMMVMK